MSAILWAEDEPQYVQDVLDELKERHNLDCQVVEDCSGLLKALTYLADDTRVIVLDLWLPEGDDPEGMPEELKSQKRNTDRGLWLCERVLQELRIASRQTPVVILTGNADTDTIAKLEAVGIPKQYRLKKPVAFGPFVDLIASLAAHGVA